MFGLYTDICEILSQKQLNIHKHTFYYYSVSLEPLAPIHRFGEGVQAQHRFRLGVGYGGCYGRRVMLKSK